MDGKKVLKEIVSLLYWTMLAACTVGPGTVVTCARAGAEFQLTLIWALLFASVLAYTLQEGTARLTITSGRSLGQCLQIKYRNGKLLWDVGIICWVVAGSVYIGNTFFECNNWAGGMAAIYSLPGAENTHGLRIGCCIAYGVFVLIILFADKVDSLGVALGLVMMGMVILFLIVVIRLGLDGERFAKGLIPLEMPSGSANIVLSLIGTTAIGFNVFFGGAMAEGKTLPEAQRGIAFSTFTTLVVSVLIMIVGDGTHVQTAEVFTIASLAGIIEELSGKAGLWIFGIGFIAAAVSSMLIAPLGAAMTAESVFAIYETFEQVGEQTTVENGDSDKVTDFKSEETNRLSGNKDPKNYSKNSQTISEPINNVEEGFNRELHRPFPKLYKIGPMVVMVIVAVIVVGADSPTVKVILIAQVFNGCLLPFFCICLLVCLNDPQFMNKRPQKGWANCFLIAVVMVTLFLTCNTIIQNIFGWIVFGGHASASTFERIKFSVAGVVSFVAMVALFMCTTLGCHVVSSFKKRRATLHKTEAIAM